MTDRPTFVTFASSLFPSCLRRAKKARRTRRLAMSPKADPKSAAGSALHFFYRLLTRV